MTDYGSLIKEAREKAGLTQEQLGKAIGVTGVAIMRYEKGQRNPSSKVIGKIASVLGTDFALSVIDEVDNSLSKALDRKNKFDEELNARHEQIKRAWKAAELKAGKKLSFDEAMSYYRINVATTQRLEAAISKLNDEGRKVALERIEELTLIDKYTLPKDIEEYQAKTPSETILGEGEYRDTPKEEKPPEGKITPNDGNK